MGLGRKENIKEIIIVSIISILIMMTLMGLISYTQYQDYVYEFNQKTAQVVSDIIQSHPELELEIVQAIQNTGKRDNTKGVELLKQYGLEEREKAYGEELNNKMMSSIKMNIFVIAILGILLTIIFLVYIVIKDKKIDQMTKYLQRIQSKDYSLKIEDNTEGELSDLRNEIYKVTVMLKEQAEQLAADKKHLENSISDISHQIKTPLTSISVMVDVLKENPRVPEDKKREFLYEVSRQLEWINWLVISLLKLSKLDAGTADLKKEKVLVKPLIEEVIKDLSIPIEIKNQTVTAYGKEETSFVGDWNWSLEAILNIVKNCLEHTPDGKSVDISYQENMLYTEITITDTGEGIHKQDIAHIFERFYKGKNASKDSIGIGLALAQSIIKSQGGDITVRSEQGKGSTFTIQLFKGVI